MRSGASQSRLDFFAASVIRLLIGLVEVTADIMARVGTDGQEAAFSRPPSGDVGILVVALFAVSTSGPLIAATAAPALAIAFWRNALASGVLVPWAFARCRAELRGLTRREWRLALGAGLLLALHFGTWVPSLSYTTVASATALVATQPVWAALLARAQGQLVNRRAWTGIGVAVAGVAILSGLDFSLSSRALVGDLLAVIGGAFAAAYMVAGAEVRQTVSTTTYTTICYATCAVALVVVCLVGGVHLSGYSGLDWVKLGALTVGAQLLGHSLFNRVLRTTDPSVVSLSILLEVPGAAVLAAIFLNQIPSVRAAPAALMVIGGIVLVVRSSRPTAVLPE